MYIVRKFASRLPKIFDLRADPFERADHESIGYSRWRADRTFLPVPAQAFVGNFLKTFKDYPPRQEPGGFSIEQVLRRLQAVLRVHGPTLPRTDE